jgi:hypothetical protein
VPPHFGSWEYLAVWPQGPERSVTSAETLDLTRRVTLKGHLHPMWAARSTSRAGEKREGPPEEAERNT